MAFNISWEAQKIKKYLLDYLQDFLDKVEKPSFVVDKIYITDLIVGDKSPELGLIEVHNLDSLDAFKFVSDYHIKYSGKFKIRFQTKLQLNFVSNPLSQDGSFSSLKTLSAHKPFYIPFSFSISDIIVDGSAQLVINNGIVELFFKENPIKNIKIQTSLANRLGFFERKIQKFCHNFIKLFFKKN